MVSEYEARKLQHDLKPELNATSAAVWKCAAGLLGLVILVLMGTGIDLRHDGDIGPTAARESMQHQEPASAASRGEDVEKHTKHLELVSHGQ